MAEHKAPTAVTVAPITEKSSFEHFIAKYWVHATLLLLVVVAGVVVNFFLEQGVVDKRDANWASVTSLTTPNPYTQVPEGDPEALAGLALQLKETAAGTAARVLEVHSRIEEGDYAGARTALASLRQEHPDHPFVKEAYSDEGGGSITLPDQLGRRIDELEAWEQAHPEWEVNPPLPENAPRVRLVTGKGDIVVALYVTEAPEHTANFLARCQDGTYDTTLFHRTVPGFMIQGGDPNTKDREDKAGWGQGGPDEKIDPESNRLRHFAGVLSAAKKPGETESSGSQFFITTDPAHHLNGQHVVYGAVVEGMDVVQMIVSGAIDPEGPSGDRPTEPVAIESVEIL